MPGNGVYPAPGGLFPTLDDIRAGITTDSNKGSYSMVAPTLLVAKGSEPVSEEPKASTPSEN